MATDVIERKIANLARICDLNNDGVIERSDFEMWINRLALIRGWEKRSEGYERLASILLGTFEGVRKAACAEDGRVDIPTMSRLLAASQNLLTAPHRWGEALFQLIDADGDGVIGLEDYRNLLATLYIRAEVADEAFARLDVDGDGRLSRDEFHLLHVEFFTSNDPEAPGSWLWGPF